jgi:hypothetical protein
MGPNPRNGPGGRNNEEHSPGWVFLGGFLAELAIFVVVIPLSLVVGLCFSETS